MRPSAASTAKPHPFRAGSETRIPSQTAARLAPRTGIIAGGRSRMWVAVSAQCTVYAILPGRGFDQVRQLSKPDYEGCLEHDGWSVYYHFEKALHQSCLAHLVRRCRDLIEILPPAAARFPLAVLTLFEQALKLHTRWQSHEIGEHGLHSAAGRIEARLGQL